MGIKHAFTSAKADTADPTKVRPSNWNADHTIDGDVDFNGFEITNCPSLATPSLEGVIDVINVKDPPYNAVGDGVTDDTQAIQDAIDAAWVVCTGNAQDPPSGNKILYLPNGIYVCNDNLIINGALGVVMKGAGRFATQLRFAEDRGIVGNGIAYSRFQDFYISGSGDGQVLFDLDWDGSSYCNTQSNVFENMFFQGNYPTTYPLGVLIGDSGFQASENLFLNCFWSGIGIGIYVDNFNALQNTVVGGNFQTSDYAIYVRAGSVPVIDGVGFQLSETWDVFIENASWDNYSINGCRTESENFVSASGFLTPALDVGPTISINACSQTHESSGTFANLPAGGLIAGCISRAGTATVASGQIIGSNLAGTQYGTVIYGSDAVVVNPFTFFGDSIRVDDTIIMEEEGSPPAAPAANEGTLYLEDNGAGKTRLMIRFNTGASQQIAIEP